MVSAAGGIESGRLSDNETTGIGAADRIGDGNAVGSYGETGDGRSGSIVTPMITITGITAGSRDRCRTVISAEAGDMVSAAGDIESGSRLSEGEAAGVGAVMSIGDGDAVGSCREAGDGRSRSIVVPVVSISGSTA